MKRIVIFLLSVSLALAAKAQDPHFSQYHASPLTLSPAMTGYMKGEYRVAGNFRTQYWAIGSSFTTGTISYEKRLNVGSDDKKDFFAVGGMGLYDKSSNGGFKSVNVSVSGAFHKYLDYEGYHSLALGFQTGFATRSINYSGLAFATQFKSGTGFDLSVPNEELGLNQNKSYFDLNSGLLYSYNNELTRIYFGTALYHINKPNISFLNDQKYKLPMRVGVHTAGRFVTGEAGNHVLVSLSYMNQEKATDFILGTAYGVNLGTENKTVEVAAGCWYRSKDAIIPYASMEYDKIQVGVSYDVISMGKRGSTLRTGGFEVSLRYNGIQPRNYYTNYKQGRVF